MVTTMTNGLRNMALILYEIPEPRMLEVSVCVFDKGTEKKVAVSTSSEDTRSETKALTYLMEYIS